MTQQSNAAPTEPAAGAAPPAAKAPADVLARLAAYRQHDAPTHGGRVLSYVYDSALGWVDELAGAAALSVQPVNGLDPTTFPSFALLEGDMVAFTRRILRDDPTRPTGEAVGAATSGGTESCLLAVLAARNRWRRRHDQPQGRPTVVLPSTAHGAFHKAAHYFDVDLDLVAVDPATGTLPAARLVERFDDDTCLVVVGAPSYPHGVLDPVVEVAAAAAERGIPCHVDACIGGLVLPWWEAAGGGPVPAWDLSVPGVTSVAIDLHKYGYSPKGCSVLVFADRELDLERYYSHTNWPGYPLVNPTMLGSRSAMALAAAWAVVSALGEEGYLDLTRSLVASTRTLHETVDGIEGLRVIGDPLGPLLAVAADEGVEAGRRVDPHRWSAAMAARGFALQGQPALRQADGTVLARSTHLTITPATATVLDDLVAAMVAAADEVRGVAGAGAAAPSGGDEAGGVASDAPDLGGPDGIPDPELLAQQARETGSLDLTDVLALIEQLPREVSADLLVRFLAAFTRPR